MPEIDGFLNQVSKIDGFLGTQEPMLMRLLVCNNLDATVHTYLYLSLSMLGAQCTYSGLSNKRRATFIDFLAVFPRLHSYLIENVFIFISIVKTA